MGGLPAPNRINKATVYPGYALSNFYRAAIIRKQIRFGEFLRNLKVVQIVCQMPCFALSIKSFGTSFVMDILRNFVFCCVVLIKICTFVKSIYGMSFMFFINSMRHA